MYLAQYFYCQLFQLEGLTDHIKDHQLASSNDHFTTLVNLWVDCNKNQVYGSEVSQAKLHGNYT